MVFGLNTLHAVQKQQVMMAYSPAEAKKPLVSLALVRLVDRLLARSPQHLVLGFCLRFISLCILHSPTKVNALPLPLRRRLAAGLVAAGEVQLSLGLFDDGSVPVEPPPKGVLHGVLAGLRERPVES